jgi:hypothetical protein
MVAHGGATRNGPQFDHLFAHNSLLAELRFLESIVRRDEGVSNLAGVRMGADECQIQC